MSNPDKKYLKLIGSLILVTLILLGSFWYQGRDRYLEVIFFDVGQGDATLINTPAGKKILIDGGPDNKVVTRLGPYFGFYDKNIDLMILTHAHSDHLVGLVEVLKRYKIKKILYTGVVQTTPEYLEWLKLIKEKNIPLEIAVAGHDFLFDSNIKLKILFPLDDLTNQKFADLNQSSIVCAIVYNEVNFLFMGDLPSEQEEQLLKIIGTGLKADILKVGHHGSKYSTSNEFLKTVNPALGIISVGVDNKFGHPNPLTLNKLNRYKVKILRTDQQGEIEIKSNGDDYWLP